MVDLQDQDVLAIVTRAPSAGGKTRLFAELGRAPDPEFLAALFLDTFDAAACPQMTRVVCYVPASAEDEIRALVPPGVPLLAQRGEDLGERMRHAFEDLLARGAASVSLIGSDLPGIDAAAIIAARNALREQRDVVVIGPALDGGYYLVGATRMLEPLFRGMVWSRPDVLAQTERRAHEAGLRVVRLPSTRDIDSLTDLRALLESDAPAVRTRRYCRALSV